MVADLESRKVQVDNSAFPQIYQRDEGEHLHMGVLLPGFASRDTCTMAANCSSLTLVGDISHLEAPFSPVDTSNSTSGPFGPFSREVQLAHPVDVSVPVESRMGLGIIEFRYAELHEGPRHAVQVAPSLMIPHLRMQVSEGLLADDRVVWPIARLPRARHCCGGICERIRS